MEAWGNPDEGQGRIVHANTGDSTYSLTLEPAYFPVQHFDRATRVELTGALDLSNRDFTVELWAKRGNARGCTEPFLSHGNTSGVVGQCLHLNITPQNTVKFGLFGDDLVTAQAYPDLDWHHWARCTCMPSASRSSIGTAPRSPAAPPRAPMQGTGRWSWAANPSPTSIQRPDRRSPRVRTGPHPPRRSPPNATRGRPTPPPVCWSTGPSFTEADQVVQSLSSSRSRSVDAALGLEGGGAILSITARSAWASRRPCSPP